MHMHMALCAISTQRAASERMCMRGIVPLRMTYLERAGALKTDLIGQDHVDQFLQKIQHRLAVQHHLDPLRVDQPGKASRCGSRRRR